MLASTKTIENRLAYIEAHFDAGGFASQANAVELFNLAKELHGALKIAGEYFDDDFQGDKSIDGLIAEFNKRATKKDRAGF